MKKQLNNKPSLVFKITDSFCFGDDFLFPLPEKDYKNLRDYIFPYSELLAKQLDFYQIEMNEKNKKELFLKFLRKDLQFDETGHSIEGRNWHKDEVNAKSGMHAIYLMTFMILLELNETSIRKYIAKLTGKVYRRVNDQMSRSRIIQFWKNADWMAKHIKEKNILKKYPRVPWAWPGQNPGSGFHFFWLRLPIEKLTPKQKREERATLSAKLHFAKAVKNHWVYLVTKKGKCLINFRNKKKIEKLLKGVTPEQILNTPQKGDVRTAEMQKYLLKKLQEIGLFQSYTGQIL